MKKWRLPAALGVVAVCVAALACSARPISDAQRTLATLREVDEHPLYVMTYYGDYGFAEFLKHGRRVSTPRGMRLDAVWRGRLVETALQDAHASQGALPWDNAVAVSTKGVETALGSAPASSQPAETPLGNAPASSQPAETALGNAPAWACTCFSALNPEGTPLFGRNFDWDLHPALLLFTDPPEGYASVSMVDAAYLGLGSQPLSATERRKFLDAPYWPFDGMNECGVAIGVMAVPAAEAPRDPDKVTIGSLHAVRLVLDQARDVEQGIALLGQYNLDRGSGPPLHYLLADRGGASAVVELVRGEMRVLRNRDAWQVATNFLLSEAGAASPDDLCARYREANATLTRCAGRLSSEDAMALLGRVSQPITRWSALYDLRTGDVRVAMGREYGRVHEFGLGMR